MKHYEQRIIPITDASNILSPRYLFIIARYFWWHSSVHNSNINAIRQALMYRSFVAEGRCKDCRNLCQRDREVYHCGPQHGAEYGEFLVSCCCCVQTDAKVPKNERVRCKILCPVPIDSYCLCVSFNVAAKATSSEPKTHFSSTSGMQGCIISCNVSRSASWVLWHVRTTLSPKLFLGHRPYVCGQRLSEKQKMFMYFVDSENQKTFVGAHLQRPLALHFLIVFGLILSLEPVRYWSVIFNCL